MIASELQKKTEWENGFVSKNTIKVKFQFFFYHTSFVGIDIQHSRSLKFIKTSFETVESSLKVSSFYHVSCIVSQV